MDDEELYNIHNIVQSQLMEIKLPRKFSVSLELYKRMVQEIIPQSEDKK